MNPSDSPEYAVREGMIQRCYNPKARGFERYGGAGVTICQRWRESFSAFLADMGPRPGPGYQIERIDNAKGYEPGNCRWATRSEQQRNTSQNHLLTAFGITLPLVAWAEQHGLKWTTLRERLARGWHPERALTTPPQPKRRTHHQARTSTGPEPQAPPNAESLLPPECTAK